MLISAGAISEAQLQEALQLQETEGGRLGVILTHLGFIDTKTLTKHLTAQTQANINRLKSD